MYGIFFGLLLLVWFRFTKRPLRSAKSDYALLFLLLTQTLVMVGTEVAYCLPPALPLTKGNTLFVLGDSLSIGADPPGKNWPDFLGDLAHLKVRNFAFGGARVETALSDALRIDTDDALVILELGGNDLLGGTGIARFRADLEQMLARVCTARRRVVMIELPLPPFYNRYGMVQRELARSHGVILVPKRFLATVLTTPGATVDGLHLSNAGHALFARRLFELREDRASIKGSQ
jgi:acyl-CoA thioesterase-1